MGHLPNFFVSKSYKKFAGTASFNLPMVRNWPVSTALGTQFYFFFELFF
jgi:hypothetical protein